MFWGNHVFADHRMGIPTLSVDLSDFGDDKPQCVEDESWTCQIKEKQTSNFSDKEKNLNNGEDEILKHQIPRI